MKYFVIAPDGNKYGPADLATLNAWIAEGRLTPGQMLEDELGTRTPASAVPGLNFPSAAAPSAPQAPAPGATMYQPGQQPFNQAPGYYPRGTGYVGDNGQSDLTQAYIFGALGIFCCGLIFPLLGISAANRAEAKGNPGAKGAKILCYIGLAWFVIQVVGYFILGAAGTIGR